MKFALEIIRNVRKEVADEFPILSRMSGDEKIEGGHGLKESKVITHKLEEGGVDALGISAGVAQPASHKWAVSPMEFRLAVMYLWRRGQRKLCPYP